MKHGTISNRTTPRILIRMNDTMFNKVPKPSIINKVKYTLGLPLTTEYQIKWATLHFIERMIMERDYNLHLVYLQDEDEGYSDKETLLNQSTLTHLNILVYKDTEPLFNLLNIPNTYLVDTNCVRDKIYTLEEAIHLF